MSIYEKHIFKDSRLPFIIHTTHYKQMRKVESAVGNWHENVELLLIERGEGIIRLNNRSISATAGDVVVVNQNVIHSIIPSGELFYYCVIVDRAFCLSNHFDTNTIFFEEHIRDCQLFGMIKNVSEEYLTGRNEPYGIQSIRAGILATMTLLCRKYGKTDVHTASDSHLNSCIRQALGCISSESHRDIFS